MSPHLRLYLLGPPRLERDGVPIVVDTHKAIALLAYLAVVGSPQRRDTLVDLLWPDSAPSDGHNALRRTLSVLRTALAGEWLQTDREAAGLSSHTDAWSDVSQVSASLAQCLTHGHPSTSICPACLPLLAEVAALYRGDFMSGFGLKDAPDFDDWQVQEAEELRAELSRTLERLVQGYAAQGDFESAIMYGRRWLALDRLNEAAHGQLMRLYAWSGRRSAALQQYQECVKTLQEQLGVSPQDSLAALHDAIRSGVPVRPSSPARGEDNAGTLVPAVAALGQPAAPAQPLPATSVLEEKRVVTALYVDVSGAFAAAGEAGESDAVLVQRFVTRAGETVHRYGGHVARSAGDGILAVFGAALTRESGPELAIRAALDLQDEAKRLGLRLNAGISTGDVYTITIGTSAAAVQQPGLVGRAIDVALRLATQDQPGRILVAAPTYRVTQRAFAFAPFTLTIGAGKPVLVYQVESLLPQPTKARGIDGMRAELTGRDDELDRLKSALERACHGEGQMVSIIGEAGVGKSRLVAELRSGPSAYAQVDSQPSLWREGRCLEMAVPLSYAPFLDILHAYFGWTAQDDEATRRQSVASCLQQLVEQGCLDTLRADEVGAMLCRLLSLPVAERWADRLRQAGPEHIRSLTFLAVRDFCHALARRQPLVLVFEDLHWCDSLSLDLIALLMDGLREHALFLLCVYRPEREQAARHLAAMADQTCRDCYTELHLRELTRPQSERLVRSLLKAQTLPGPLQDAVLNRAQGNPFFIEELIRSLIESGAIYRDEAGWRTRPDIDVTGIPDSIQNVVLSRVDRLDAESKHVLQTAAVIGRVFRPRVVQAATGLAANLEDTLDDLAERALVYQERAFPEAEYSFKHVLAQQAVYQAMLSTQRADLHRRVAGAIETLYRDNLTDYCEQLAYHYERSGQAEKAVGYLLQAGEKAKRQYANATAVAHLAHALDLLQTLPDGRQRDARELELLIALGSPLGASKGYSADELERTYSRARELALRLGEMPQLFPALHGLWRLHFNRMHLADAHTLASELMDLAQATQDPGLLLEAHRALGYTLQILGDFAGSLAHTQEGLALYDAGAYHPHSVFYGQDPATTLLMLAGANQWGLGYPDRALACVQRLLSLADTSADPFNQAVALVHATYVYWLRGAWDEVEKHSSAAIKISTERNYPFWLADALVRHGGAISWRGQIPQGIAEMERALAMLQALGHAAYDRKLLLAQPYAMAGRIDDAFSAVEETQRYILSIGAHQSESNAYLLKGDLLLRLGRSEEAEACFQHALEIARRQQIKGWELRAATSLARLWQKQGKRDEARALLQDVYGWFTEGFDTQDLKDAKVLLDKLA